MGALAHAVESQPIASSRGYTPVDHRYFEVLPKKVSGNVQYVCIGIIQRNTLGKERRKGAPPPEWADIDYKVFCRCTGATENAVSKALTDAAKRGLIERKQHARGWLYKTDPATWAKCRAYEPEPPKKLEALEAEPDADVDAAAPKSKPVGAIVVRAGRRSKPVPLAAPCKSVVCQNESGEPLSFASLTEGETLVVSIHSETPKPAAAPPVNGTKSHAIPTLQYRYSDAPTQSNQRDTRFAEIREFLGPIFDARYGSGVDDRLVAAIVARLGPASADRYKVVVQSKVGKKKDVPSGRFLWCADDARAGHLQAEARNNLERERAREDERRGRIMMLATILKFKDHPELGEIYGDPYALEMIESATPDELSEARRAIDDGRVQ